MTSTTSPRGEWGSEDRDPRKCDHAYDDGSLCKGWKVKGTSLCGGHLGTGVAADPQEAASRSAVVRREMAEERSERLKAAPRSTKEALAAAALELQGEIVDAYRAAIRTGDPEDLRRAEAAERLLSRVHGKPKETVEQVAGKTPIDEAVERMSTEELEVLVQQGIHLRAVQDEAVEH